MSIGTEDLLAMQTVVVWDDLEIPVESSAVIAMVFDAVHQANWVPSRRAADAEAAPEPVLRSVLTYCYALGICSSEEVEAAALHDPVVRYLCAHHEPDWKTIREFRRRNILGFKEALAAVFEAALWRHAGTYRGFSLARLRATFPDHQAEAERRLARAMQADSHALDV